MLFTRLKVTTFGLLLVGLFGCSKADVAKELAGISPEVQAKISAMGFRASDAYAVEGGYIVEGDIFLTEENIQKGLTVDNHVVTGKAEQYRTTNLVTGLPRVIRVGASVSLTTAVVHAIDAAIARYNTQGLSLTFQRVSSSPNITITAAPSSATYLASAGFPSGGNPHNLIYVNLRAISGWNSSTVTSIIAHEMGHCIGFRHTDYMGRQYSCGGSPVNEGASTVGAIHIPGTPTGPDPNSWMLACIGNGVNRPFNANDITALNYLY